MKLVEEKYSIKASSTHLSVTRKRHKKPDAQKYYFSLKFL